MRLLVTGGSGSGTSSVAKEVAEVLGLRHFDSDQFFHKLTDPPYQEFYSSEERRELAQEALLKDGPWVLSGSVATWGLGELYLTHAILLRPSQVVRVERIRRREASRFGDRIRAGGDMQQTHLDFIEWTKSYEGGQVLGRNLKCDRAYLDEHLTGWLELRNETDFEGTVAKVVDYLNA